MTNKVLQFTKYIEKLTSLCKDKTLHKTIKKKL